MFVLLLLYIIPLVIQVSYSYNFFLKFEWHETDYCKNFRAFFKSQKHSKWSNQSTFQNLNSKFHCAMLHFSVSMMDLVCVRACVPAYTCVFLRGDSLRELSQGVNKNLAAQLQERALL